MGTETEATSTEAAPIARADYQTAKVLACALVGLLTVMGTLFPPALSWDAGMGMLAWRSMENGAPFNVVSEPDAADISRDQSLFLTWWSPGQYLIPGALTLLGLRLGQAVTVTTGLSLMCCLIGWIRVARHFALSPQTAALLVVFMSTFRYSARSFQTYSGGEILLQGVVPWLVLAGCRVPAATAAKAAWLACLVVSIGFFTKLTGMIVAGASLIAGSAAAYRRSRQVSHGMVGGAIGAIATCGFLYVTWFSRGVTPATPSGWSFEPRAALFALSAPWGAGVSWEDFVALLRLGRPHEPSAILWFLLPMFLFVGVIMGGWRRCANALKPRGLITITMCFYAVFSLALEVVYLRGGDVGLDERHFRSAGALIFVFVLAVVEALPRKSLGYLSVLTFCGLMSVYGLALTVHFGWSARWSGVDPYSRLRQDDVDMRAIEFARAAFVREGRDDLFVIDNSGAASAFPPDARVLVTKLAFEPELTTAAQRYPGRVRGRVYVMMLTSVAQAAKGTLFLKSFTSYPVNAWERHQFGNTTVFVQGGQPS